MKISVSSYSFGAYADKSSLGVLGIMDEAKKMGFDGIELVEFPEISDSEFLREIRRHSEDIDLPIVALDVGADFTKNDCSCVHDEIERVCALVDTAAALGSPLMRHDVSYGSFSRAIGFDDALPTMIQGCRAVAEYASHCGVKTMFENHGYFLQDSDRVEKLICGVAHPNFGYLIDVGNFMCADEEPTHAVGRLARFATHAHAKDFHFKRGSTEHPGEGWFATRGGNYLRGAVIGHGDADCAQSIRLLKACGYDGYVTLEFEGIEDNLRGISLGLENLKKYVK